MLLILFPLQYLAVLKLTLEPKVIFFFSKYKRKRNRFMKKAKVIK